MTGAVTSGKAPSTCSSSAHACWILRAPAAAEQRNDNVPCKPKLFCIPQAGMGAWVYHSWSKLMPGVDVVPLELPGHNSRLRRDAPMTDLLQLARCIADVIVREVTGAAAEAAAGSGCVPGRRGSSRGANGSNSGSGDSSDAGSGRGDNDGAGAQLAGGAFPRYAIYGHSLGAWIAYEVVMQLQRMAGATATGGDAGDVGAGRAPVVPLPVCAYVGANRSPSLCGAAHDLDPTRLSQLADCEAFFAALERRYGHNPSLAHPQVRSALYPVLHADFTVLETYQCPPANPPLCCPLAVFAASDDNRYTPQQVAVWRAHAAQEAAGAAAAAAADGDAPLAALAACCLQGNGGDATAGAQQQRCSTDSSTAGAGGTVRDPLAAPAAADAADPGGGTATTTTTTSRTQQLPASAAAATANSPAVGDSRVQPQGRLAPQLQLPPYREVWLHGVGHNFAGNPPERLIRLITQDLLG